MVIIRFSTLFDGSYDSQLADPVKCLVSASFRISMYQRVLLDFPEVRRSDLETWLLKLTDFSTEQDSLCSLTTES